MVQDQVGKLLESEGYRDAIHIAVAPVEACRKLHAGDHISIADGKADLGGETVAIVDPFLMTPVQAGQRFFAWLYPNSITDMHHHWTHPAFDGQAAPSKDGKSEARKRIEEMAKAIGD